MLIANVLDMQKSNQQLFRAIKMKISFLTKLKTYFFSLIQKEESKIEVKSSKDSFQCSITISEDEYKRLNDPMNYCPDCGSYQYGCAGNYFWPCFKYRETILSKLSKKDRKEIEEIENNEELSKRYRVKLINDYLDELKLESFLRSDFDVDKF